MGTHSKSVYGLALNDGGSGMNRTSVRPRAYVAAPCSPLDRFSQYGLRLMYSFSAVACRNGIPNTRSVGSDRIAILNVNSAHPKARQGIRSTHQNVPESPHSESHGTHAWTRPHTLTNHMGSLADESYGIPRY